MTTYEAADKEIHDCHLMDIAFEMRQGDVVKKLRAKHFFTDSLFWSLNNNLKLIRKNKERLTDEYRNRYGKAPDTELAKRLFLENEKTPGGAGPDTGNADNNNTVTGQNDLGDQAA